MSTKQRYLELIELADCSPDSPMLANPEGHEGDRQLSAQWLSVRLAMGGHMVKISECREALDAYLTPRRICTNCLRSHPEATMWAGEHGGAVYWYCNDKEACAAKAASNESALKDMARADRQDFPEDSDTDEVTE